MRNFQVLLFVVPFTGVVVFFLYKIIHSIVLGRRIYRLSQMGIIIEGKVLGRDQKHDRAYQGHPDPPTAPQVPYEFVGPTGKTLKGKGIMPFLEYKRITPGMPLKICYLPEKPSVNAPNALIEEYRQKLSEDSSP